MTAALPAITVTPDDEPQPKEGGGGISGLSPVSAGSEVAGVTSEGVFGFFEGAFSNLERAAAGAAAVGASVAIEAYEGYQAAFKVHWLAQRTASKME